MTHPSTHPVLAPRLERALVTLAIQTQQLDERIDRLERRMDELTLVVADTDLHVPTHEDLLEVRLHSAKVAAEVARVNIELRSEIERTLNRRQHRERRIDTLAEQIIDLSDSLYD